MSTNGIAKLNAKLRAIGYDLAQAEMRGMKSGNFLARKLAHGILLNQLCDLEKRA